MIRHLTILAVTFALGAVLAITIRTRGHQPYAVPPAPAPVAAPAPGPAAAPDEVPPAPAPAPAEAPPATADAPAPAPINTICPGCGGPVKPNLPTALYQGKVIGFNCAGCLPMFREDPTKYGEAALKNVMAE